MRTIIQRLILVLGAIVLFFVSAFAYEDNPSLSAVIANQLIFGTPIVLIYFALREKKK